MAKQPIPVQTKQTYQGTVVDLTYQGLGVVKVDDFPIFIENALPGEQIEFEVTKPYAKYAFGKVTKMIEESPDRNHDTNDIFLQTGIAPLSHLKYDAQLKFKQHQIQTLFNKAHIDVEVLPTIGMERPYEYRNKAQIPVKNIKGKLTTGFYRRHSHQLVPIDNFYIQQPEIDHAIMVVRDILNKFKVPAYNEQNHKGVIRTIMIRRGYYTHQMMIGLVTRTKKVRGIDAMVNEIVAKLPEVKSVVQNVNLQDSNVLLGSESKLLWGKKYIQDDLLGLKFDISLNSFYQVNPLQTEKLYELAIEKANITKDDTVIDAYCGIGTISLAMAQHAKKVYGVEIVSEAIKDAKRNAKLNDISNVQFITNDAGKQMVKWAAEGLKPDVVMVDPPRKGLSSEFIDQIAVLSPKKVVYVSCNPSTLVRDAGLLQEHGYQINQPVQPVDQFPQTVHVESVTVFEK